LDYKINVNIPEYFGDSRKLTTQGELYSKEFSKLNGYDYDFALLRIPKEEITIDDIYYDYNSTRITPESRRQLDQLAVILERNATIGLDLNAHTDARGDAAYNLKLSQQRADAAIVYLSSKGLPSQRFNSRGFGESRLLNECCDGVSCTEPEHGLNRRTEIRLRTLLDTAVLPE
jgi:outer membrane protein OmpA-like peptidoglycan-associated protein